MEGGDSHSPGQSSAGMSWRPSKEDFAALPCAVCSAQADGIHYGAVSCRSCNAFFRRAVTFNQRYECRFSGKCDVSQQVRCACRACRFAKCLAAGMRESAVQPRRDPTGSQRERRRGLSSRPSSTNSPEASTSSRGGRREELPSSSRGLYSNTSSVSGFSIDSEGEEDHKFELLVHSFTEHLRLMQLKMTPIESFLLEHDEGVKFRPMQPVDVDVLSKTELAGLMYWIEKQEPFRDLDLSDRRALFKRYSVRKLTLDHMFVASRHKHHAAHGNFVMLNNTFVPPGSTGFETVYDDERKKAGKAEALLPTFERFWRCTVIPMIELKITPAEMVFLHSHLLWSVSNNQHVSSQTRERMRQRREWACRRLFQHYRRTDLIDPEVRFGEVCLLLPELEVICNHHCSDYQVAKLFDYADLSSSWYEDYCYSTVNTMQLPDEGSKESQAEPARTGLQIPVEPSLSSSFSSGFSSIPASQFELSPTSSFASSARLETLSSTPTTHPAFSYSLGSSPFTAFRPPSSLSASSSSSSLPFSASSSLHNLLHFSSLVTSSATPVNESADHLLSSPSSSAFFPPPPRQPPQP